MNEEMNTEQKLRLMKAAPRMLEALELIVAVSRLGVEHQVSIGAIAAQAIKEAT